MERGATQAFGSDDMSNVKPIPDNDVQQRLGLLAAAGTLAHALSAVTSLEDVRSQVQVLVGEAARLERVRPSPLEPARDAAEAIVRLLSAPVPNLELLAQVGRFAGVEEDEVRRMYLEALRPR